MDLTQLLLRLFVKDYRNTEDPAVRTRYGKLAGIVGIVCNVLLSAGKLLAGTLSGAVSITADGLNNLSDAASSLVTLLGSAWRSGLRMRSIRSAMRAWSIFPACSSLC